MVPDGRARRWARRALPAQIGAVGARDLHGCTNNLHEFTRAARHKRAIGMSWSTPGASTDDRLPDLS